MRFVDTLDEARHLLSVYALSLGNTIWKARVGAALEGLAAYPNNRAAEKLRNSLTTALEVGDLLIYRRKYGVAA